MIKKKGVLFLLVLLLGTCIFTACANKDNSEGSVYKCTITEDGTETEYYLSFSDGKATLQSISVVIYRSYTGTIVVKGENTYVLQITQSGEEKDIPDFLKKVEITITDDSFTFSSLSQGPDGGNVIIDRPEQPNEPVVTPGTNVPEETDKTKPETGTDKPGGTPTVDDENDKNSSECKHTGYMTIGGIEPTCTESGITAKKICSSCGKTINESEFLAPLGHSAYVSNAGVAPTCFSDGKTEEESCSRCGEILRKAEIIDQIDHDGRVCSMCHRIDYTGEYVSLSSTESTGNDEQGTTTVVSKKIIVNMDKVTYSVTTTTEFYCVASISIDSNTNIIEISREGVNINAPEEYGFTLAEQENEDHNYEMVFERLAEGIYEKYYFVNDTNYFVNVTGTYVRISSETEDVYYDYEADSESPTIMFNGNGYKLNFKDNSFIECGLPVTVSYMVNGEKIKEQYYEDNGDLLCGLSSDEKTLSWYLDKQGTIPYNVGKKITSSQIDLYSFIQYYDTFTFNGHTRVVEHGDGTQTMSDIVVNLLNDDGVVVKGSEYHYTLMLNGIDVMNSYAFPERYSINGNRNFVLAVAPNEDYLLYEITSNLDNQKYLAVVSKDVANGASATNIVNAVGLDSIFIGCTVNFTDERAIYCQVEYVTVTYVLNETVYNDIVRKGIAYAIKQYDDIETWYEVSGTTYLKGEEITPTADFYMYSAKYVATSYNGIMFITEIFYGSMPANYGTEEYEGFGFKEFKYSSTLNYGEIHVDAVYEKIEGVAPTKTSAGYVRITTLINGTQTTDEKSVPILNAENYTLTTEVEPSLVGGGREKYSSESYGTYYVEIEKVSTQTFIYNGISYTVSLVDNKNATIAYNGNTYDAKYIESNGSISFEITYEESGSNTEEARYAISLIDENSFICAEANNAESLTACSDSISNKNYYGYDKRTDYVFVSGGGGIQDINNDGNLISVDGGNSEYTYEEPCGVYVQNGYAFSVSSQRNAIVVALAEEYEKLCQSDRIEGNNIDDEIPIYLMNNNTLTVNGTTCTLVANGETTVGTLRFESGHYILYVVTPGEVQTATKTYLYSVTNGAVAFIEE